jgi:hypothetical protein
VILPATVFAQATLSGFVKDTSGGVLPGVNVEASSPVLIEKVRSGISDSTGLYRIPYLPPRDLHRHLQPARLRNRQP